MDRDTQAKIDKRNALAMKQNDEWQSINYEELTAEENTDIRVARRLGYAMFFPNGPDCGRVTLRGARKYIQAKL